MTGIGIIGAGEIAKTHTEGYLEFPDRCEVRAVCDLYPDKAEELIAAKGLKNAKAYKEIDRLLSSAEIDAVSICLPPASHAEAAVKALNAGKHVLVEKPMARSLSECDEMIAAAGKNGKVLSSVAQNRFRTPNARVKTLIQEGAAGKVLHAAVNSYWWRGPSYYDIWWRGTWDVEGGGCLTSHAVHQIDLLLWILGKPDRITAIITNVAHDNSECEDLSMAILEYPGMLAQLTVSIVNHEEKQELIFQTERGRISAPWDIAAYRERTNGFPNEDAEGKAALQKRYESIPALVHEGHTAQIKNFLGAIQGTEELAISGRDGRAAIELIMAIYKSSLNRQPVTLPIARDDVFYTRDMCKKMPRFHQKTRSIENYTESGITLGSDLKK